MIVKNEEDVLKRCLESVQDLVDEIIIVDTGSQDATKDIAYQFTNHVYDFKWEDDFSKARNFSFSKANKDYILWLDADDVIDHNNQKKIQDLKKELTCDVVMMKYQVSKHMVFYRERLLKREKHFQWIYPVHEVLQIDGQIEYVDITIEHRKEKVNDAYRNLRIYETYLQTHSSLDARGLFYYARELYEHEDYQKAVDCFLQFFKREDAWIENCIEACLDLSRCYHRLGKEQKSLESLFYSFSYDLPRSEILCELGYLYLQRKDYLKAIYWYELALKNEKDITRGGFVQSDCYDFIPYIQLCVCFERLGDMNKAKSYNEKAGLIEPHHFAYLHNKQYFENQQKT